MVFVGDEQQTALVYLAAFLVTVFILQNCQVTLFFYFYFINSTNPSFWIQISSLSFGACLTHIILVYLVPR